MASDPLLIRYIERLDNHIKDNDKFEGEIHEFQRETRDILSVIKTSLDQTSVIHLEIKYLKQAVDSISTSLQKQNKWKNNDKLKLMMLSMVGGSVSGGSITTILRTLTGG